MSDRPIESEVKFRAADLAALRAELIARGAIVTQSRHLERNTLFDDAGRSLTRRGMLLRLRDALDTTITYKAPAPPSADSGQHKTRVELEIAVSHYDTAFALLTALGYSPTWRYEKYRESLRLDDAAIALDHTPIGDFVEIEAAPESIRPTAEALGLDWGQRNLQTYRELFEEARPAGQTDMVF